MQQHRKRDKDSGLRKTDPGVRARKTDETKREEGEEEGGGIAGDSGGVREARV